MDAVEILLAAKDKVMDGWCTGHRAEDAEGRYMGLDDNPAEYLQGWDPRAVKWCLMGAIEGAQGCFDKPMSLSVTRFLRSRGYSGYINFNDGTGCSKERTIGMLDEMIMYAKDHPDLVIK